ncbi:hypothetical protein JCM10212_006432 [Sporobolomyces blumeae]
MGCMGSHEDDDSRRTKSIEEDLKATKKALRTTIRTLMLGPGESGKSTVVKQLRLAYSSPFSREERERFREVVFMNTLQSMQATLFGFEATNTDFPSERQKLASFLLMLEAEDVLDPATLSFNPSVAKAIQAIWAEPATKLVVANRSKFQLNDSAEYFFDAIPRTSAVNYLPTDEDILHTRVQNTGIVEENFFLEGTKVVVIDVGGQRSERKKWIHCFEDVQLLLFVASISEYDQYLFEDESQPRLTETLALWEGIASSPWFRKTPIVLFLNKTDILEAKVAANPQSIPKFLPLYTGSPSDVHSIKMYLLSRFKALHRHRDRTLYTHFTCATDTQAIRPILAAVMESVVVESFAHLGIL